MSKQSELHILSIRDYIMYSTSLVDYRYESYAEAVTDNSHIPIESIKLRWDFNYVMIDLNINNSIVSDLLDFLNFKNISFLNEIIELNKLKTKIAGSLHTESENIVFCYTKENTHEVHLTIQGQHFYHIDKNYIEIEHNDFFDLTYIYQHTKNNLINELAFFFNISPEEISDNHFDIARMYTE